LDFVLGWGSRGGLGCGDNDAGVGWAWLRWADRLALLAADLVGWVIDGFAIEVAALQAWCRVQVEEVWARGAAEQVVAVVLGGSTAAWVDVGIGVGLDKVVVGIDNDTAWASLF
jgi:hypothetical protein